jgi:hypothetical protein
VTTAISDALDLCHVIEIGFRVEGVRSATLFCLFQLLINYVKRNNLVTLRLGVLDS